MTSSAQVNGAATVYLNDHASGTGATTKKRKAAAVKPLMALRPYLMRYPAMVTGAIVALFAAAFATLAVPLGVRRMIDFGFSTENSDFIDQYFAMMMAIGLLLAVASAARYYFVNWLGERVVADLRDDVFRKLTTLDPSYYEHTLSGEVMSRLTADTTQIKVAVGTAATQTLRNLILFAGALVMMFFTSVKLSIMVLVAIPIIVLPLLAYGRMVRRLSRHAQDSLATSSAYAAENLSAVRVMQAFTHEAVVADRFAASVDDAFEAARVRMRARAGLTVIAIFLVIGSIIGVLWYGATEVLAGTLTGGTLGQFVLYSVFAAGALSELSQVWGEIQQASGAAERLTELLVIAPAIRSPDRPVEFPAPGEGRITFDNVQFRYPTRPEDVALDGVSFQVNAGETVAIVGPSGAGKSTIFSLLLRFYDVGSGTISIDGVDIRTARLEDVRRQIAVVPQEVVLFASSIADNIRYGSPGATMDDVRNAAQIASANDFISELPDGYDTEAGEHGVKLSGGQRQRIAIARAVLRDAPILLLDEATSALDAENERYVKNALDRAKQGRTTLIIAHRLSTVQHADKILVLDKGRLAAIGSHDELTKNDEIYRRLQALQPAAAETQSVAAS